MKPHKTGEFVGSKVSDTMKQHIASYVDRGEYISISDFVRSAIKEKLVREGYLRTKIGNERVVN